MRATLPPSRCRAGDTGTAGLTQVTGRAGPYPVSALGPPIPAGGGREGADLLGEAAGWVLGFPEAPGTAAPPAEGRWAWACEGCPTDGPVNLIS